MIGPLVHAVGWRVAAVATKAALLGIIRCASRLFGTRRRLGQLVLLCLYRLLEIGLGIARAHRDGLALGGQ